jgi:large repetitive protein
MMNWRSPARRLLPTFAVLAILLLSLSSVNPSVWGSHPAQPSGYVGAHPATITIPSKSNSGACNGVTTCNTALTTTANSALLIIVGVGGSNTPPSAVAVHGFTPELEGTKSGTTGGIWLYVVNNTTAGSKTVYANFSGNTIYQVSAIDIGNVTTLPVDAVGTGATGTASPAGASVTTTVANDVVVDAIAIYSVGSTHFSSVSTASDTAISTTVSTTGSGVSEKLWYGAGAYAIVTSATSYSENLNLNSGTASGGWWAIAIALMPASVPVAPSSLAHGSLSPGTVPLTWSNNPSSGGIGPVTNTTIYQATYSGGSCGAYSVQHSVGSAQAKSYTVTGLATGGAYCFYAVDWNTTGASGASNILSDVVADYPAPSATLSASPTTTQVGEPSTLTYGISGGTAPYTWTLERNGSSSNLTGAAGGTYSASFLHSGTYEFYFNVSDTHSKTAAATASVTVNGALLAAIMATPATTQIGEPSVLALKFTLGVPAYTWTLQRNGSVSNISGAVINSAHGANYTFTPTHAATYTYYLNATDAVGSTSKVSAAVTVKAALVATITASLSTTQVGEPSVQALVFAHGVAPYTWTLEKNGSTANLTGATINSAHGANYSFSPAHAGTYTLYLNATDSVGSTSDATASVVVEPGLVATLSASPSKTQLGASSVLTLSLSGGVAPDTWSLHVNGSSSNLTGVSGGHYTLTPTGAGTYVFYLNATDAVGSTSKVTASVTVEAALVASLSASPMITQTGRSVLLSYSFAGGVTPVSWTLEISGSASNISGAGSSSYSWSPPVVHINTAYTFYLNATDAVGSVSDKSVSVTVHPALAATLASSPSTTQVGGSSYINFTIAAGVAPVTWTLERNGSSSNISGASGGSHIFTPVGAGTYTFYLNATDAVGSTQDLTTSVTVKAALAGHLTATPAKTQVGGSSVIALSFSGGVSPITWTLTWTPSSFNITGVMHGDWTFTAATTGTFTFYLNASDAVGSVSNTTVAVTVVAALAVTVGATPATVTMPASSTISYGMTGGVTPITWTLERTGSGNVSGASHGSYVFAPPGAGVYEFYLNATDAVGSAANATVNVTVLPPAGALYTSLLASAYSIHIGGFSVLTVVVLGGTGLVRWTLEVNGSLANISGVYLGEWNFVPVATGTYTFQLVANDSALHYSISTVSVTVLPATPPAPGPPTGGIFLLLLLIPIGIFVWAIAQWSIGRQKRGERGQGSSQPVRPIR